MTFSIFVTHPVLPESVLAFTVHYLHYTMMLYAILRVYYESTKLGVHINIIIIIT